MFCYNSRGVKNSLLFFLLSISVCDDCGQEIEGECVLHPMYLILDNPVSIVYFMF